MCDACAPAGGWSRRRLLAAGLGGAAVLALPVPAAGRTRSLEIMPRSAWATGGREPRGPLVAEPEVRFLLVHHTVNANTYAETDVPAMIRSIFDYHTGSEKGWPDVAYNFLVDRFGGVWEARAGSLAGAVSGDATGGNQGFDQKCSFLGDHSSEPPTQAATDAMADLLAFLADRHGVDTSAGATTAFVSRGSNKHAAGATVTTPTITGHRTMSSTSCPGDAGYRVVTQELPGAVSARRVGATTTTTMPATTTTSSAPATTAPTTLAPSTTTTSAAPVTATTIEVALERSGDGDDRSGAVMAAAGSAIVAAGAAALLFLRGSRTRGR